MGRAEPGERWGFVSRMAGFGVVALAALAVAACDAAEPPKPADVAAPGKASPTASTAEPKSSSSAAQPALVQAHPIAQRLVLREWSRAENRADCVPVAFTDDGGAGGTSRRAYFGGGWSVAFDLPGKRSAYGLAGSGLLPEDKTTSADEHRRALAAQWPLMRDLPALPAPAFAGYGVEGAGAYPADDPQGLKVNSLAYVRVGRQACLYNIWSGLGRAHLERLLDGLRVVGTMAG